MAAKDKFLNFEVHLNISLFTAIMTKYLQNTSPVEDTTICRFSLAVKTEYGDNCKILQ